MKTLAVTLNQIDEFKWTDELVLQFTKVSQSGSYGDYSRLKKIKDKLQRFKELITIDEINRSIDPR
jgi:hypothetical protein